MNIRFPGVSKKSTILTRGYSLVEMSVVIVIGTAIGAAIISLLNFQLQWQRLFSSQNFVIEELPVVNNTVNRLLSNADSVLVYTDLTTARAQGPAATTGRAVLLRRQNQADNSFGMISLDPDPANPGRFDLKYYNIGFNLAAIPATPTWTISGGGQFLGGSGFAINAGILTFTAAGPNGEVITFATTSS